MTIGELKCLQIVDGECYSVVSDDSNSQSLQLLGFTQAKHQ